MVAQMADRVIRDRKVPGFLSFLIQLQAVPASKQIAGLCQARVAHHRLVIKMKILSCPWFMLMLMPWALSYPWTLIL